MGLAAIGLDAACQRRVQGAALLFSVVFSGIMIGALDWRGRLLEAGIRPVAQDTAALWTFAGLLPVGALLGVGRLRGSWLAGCAPASLLVVRLLEAPKLYPTFESRLFYPPVEEIRGLPEAGKPYRVVGHGYSLLPNQSTLYGLEDPRGYEAMTDARYFDTYPLWSIDQPVWYNRVDDLTTPFLALNVRFALVPRRVRFVRDGSATVEQMKRCPDFATLDWIEDRDRIPGEIENGPADVPVQAASSGLRLGVNAPRPSWVITSVTAWKGWKAYAGNEALPLFFANPAFVGFSVPAGVSDIRLVYWPTAFSVGLLIAGATVVAATVILSYRRRPREQGGNPGPSTNFFV
ncbi:MAG: YfhO family protein [Thermoanaerobaculia bacterium]